MMSRINQSIIFILFITFGLQVQANLSCSEIFQFDSSLSLESLYLQGPLGDMELVKQELQQSKTMTEVNDGIYSLVVLANRAFDTAIDLILEINFSSMPQSIKMQKDGVASHLIEYLQQNFAINDQIMGQAVRNRVNAILAEMEAQNQAMLQRRAIGFGRNESAESFHADAPPPGPIGFRFSKENKSVEEEAITPQPIGFKLQNEKDLQESINSIVEFTEPLSNRGENPIGYVTLKGGEKESTQPGPIGFVNFKSADPIVESRMSKILFDFGAGFFDLIKRP